MTLLKDSTYHSLSMAATAMLTVDANMSGTVDVRADSIDGLAPSLLTLSGHPELMDAAYHASIIQLELLGLKFRTRVAGQSKGSGNIFVVARPLFRDWARHLKTRSWH